MQKILSIVTFLAVVIGAQSQTPAFKRSGTNLPFSSYALPNWPVNIERGGGLAPANVTITNIFASSNKSILLGTETFFTGKRPTEPAKIGISDIVHSAHGVAWIGAGSGDIVLTPTASDGILQIGLTGIAGNYCYLQYAQLPDATYLVGFSHPLEFRSQSYNGGSLAYKYPGIVGMPAANNASELGELVFYARAPHWNQGNKNQAAPDIAGTEALRVGTNGIVAAPGIIFKGDGSGLTNVPGTGVSGATATITTLDGDGAFLLLNFTSGVLTSYGGLDADAASFISRAGITDAAIKSDINSIVTDLKDATKSNLWAKCIAAYPMRGGTSNSHAMNLKGTAYSITYTASGVTHNANGITGNGSTGYGDTGFNPFTGYTDSNSASLYVYSRTASAPGNNLYVMGANGSGSIFGVRDNSGNAQVICNAFVSSTIGTTWKAGLGGSRTNLTEIRGYQNGVEVVITSGSNTTPNYNAYLLCRNDQGAAGSFSAMNLAFVWIGTGLNAGEQAQLHSIVQAAQVRAGRNN